MTYEEYDAIPAVRASDLKRMRESPAHYRYPPPDTDTASRGMLRAIHCAVLEGPSEYARRFARYPGVRYGNAYTEFRTKHPGATILSAREADTVDETAYHILRHPDAGPFFTGAGQSEVTIQWKHQGSGLDCKARLDRLMRDSDGRWSILDLKSYGTTDAKQVEAMSVRLGAILQLTHYDAGLSFALGIDDARLLMVSAETKPPFDVAVFEAERGPDLYAAQGEYMRLMDRLTECRSLDYWPGRHVGVQQLRIK
jgi:hypothetical protein